MSNHYKLQHISREIACYNDGTYTIPWLDNFTPYGIWPGDVIDECSGCEEKRKLIWWIAHNVNRSHTNPDNKGNYGNYNQVSKYCADCQPIFHNLAQTIHKQPNKRCVIL